MIHAPLLLAGFFGPAACGNPQSLRPPMGHRGASQVEPPVQLAGTEIGARTLNTHPGVELLFMGIELERDECLKGCLSG